MAETGIRPPVTIEIDHAIVVRLRSEAARRDVPVRRLIHDLLDTIAYNKPLVGVVLDDVPHEAEP
jgi:hypothetical protein